MNEEVKHLARHISELEDREIEVMEALEPLDRELQAGDVTRRALDTDADRLRVAIAATEQALDAELAEENRARAAAASGVRDDLLARYEQLRSKLGGTGAARLVGGSCGGCHLALSSMELDRVRKAPPDAVITLRAVRPDPGALTSPCSSSFATVRARGTPPDSSSGEPSRR